MKRPDLDVMHSPEPDFQALFESAPGLYLVLTADLVIVAVSNAYLRATMTRRGEILGRHLFEVFPDNPEDPEATGVANLRDSLERVLRHRRPDAMAVQKYDIRRPESEGGGFEERHWSPVNSPVFGRDGALTYIIHRVEDVTDFVRLKQEGNEQHRVTEELRTRAGHMESEIFRRAQEIQEANQQLREFQAHLEERVLARTADLTETNAELQREMAERRRTEEALRQSEAQLRQSQKLEAVGRLAGGIAHDFNNLLTIILSYTDMVVGNPGLPVSCRTKIEEVHRAGERAAGLTRQLLAFSRQQVLQPTVLDVNDVLSGLSRMLGRLLGEDVELHVRLGTQLDAVTADRGQLEQVLMNLVVNARDAMPDGGRITIETSNVTLNASESGDPLGLTPGPHVLVAVTDTGHGMTEEVQARLFEPFFTTKERGKGTGLGLSTVFGIVKQSGGGIAVQTRPGAGTTFRIYLPRAEGAAESVAPDVVSMTLPRGNETVLLVDDEEQIRTVAATILRKAGYQVLVAGTPGEALELCEHHADTIDLLVTDVIMPKMNGRQLAEAVCHQRPGVRVLFISGYTDDVILPHGVLEDGVSFLQKPLTPDALTRKVRQVLDALPRAA